MDDTQNYLNDILKKRLGSVVNYGGNSKTGMTINRIPKQQQKIENMPTVFRKKHQTVYIQGSKMDSRYSQVQSQYLSMKQKSNYLKNEKNPNQMPQQNQQTSNQRVEYMLISKRILSKKDDEFISPTVDITKYSKINQTVTNSNKVPELKSNVGNLKQANSMKQLMSKKGNYDAYQLQQERSNMNEYEGVLESKGSRNTQNSKRRRIFGNQ